MMAVFLPMTFGIILGLLIALFGLVLFLRYKDGTVRALGCGAMVIGVGIILVVAIVVVLVSNTPM